MKNRFAIYPVLLAILAVLTGVLGCVSSSGGGPVIGGAAASTPTPDKVIGGFTSIDGTDIQIAPITDTGSSSFNLLEMLESSRYYSSYSGYSIYNYVFFDTRSETVHALLSDNSARITRIDGYPEPDYTLPVEERTSVRWWMFVLVKHDTNDDNVLDEEDRQTIAVSDVNGNGYIELIKDVDEVLTTVFKDVEMLLVIYHANEKYFLARIDLPTRAVISTTELPSFGDDVK